MRGPCALALVLFAAGCQERTVALVFAEPEAVQLMIRGQVRCLRIDAVTESGTNASTEGIRWMSSSPEVATVEAGCVTPKWSGRTTIHARRGDATASLLVVVAFPASLELSPAVIELRAPGASAVPKATVRDELRRRVADLPVDLKVEDERIAALGEGSTLQAKAPGVTLLTARAAGLSAVATVVVCPADLGRLIPERASLRMRAGESRRLVVRGVDVRGRPITSELRVSWAASGSVLRVNEGTVTAAVATRSVVQASACGKSVAMSVEVE